MADPDGYALWCELHACEACGGIGEGILEDETPGEWNEETQSYGVHWVCAACGGSGITPDAGVDEAGCTDI